MTQEQLKEILESKKEDLMNTVKNQATYNKWDKHSSIWIYDILTSTIEEITDIKRIEFILSTNQPLAKFFLDKKDAETYKWMIDLIERQVDEELSSGRYFKNFVSVKDLNIGDSNTFYVSDYEDNYISKCEGVMNEHREQTKYSRIDRPSKNSICN
jgi:hypothetical protein